jgi:predicted ferric reductase
VESWFHVFDGKPVDYLYCTKDQPDAVYQHMIEEYARHNGHADLLRELIDGARGS